MINQPATYVGVDADLVAAFEGQARNIQHGTFWSDPSLEALKRRVKSHYVSQQRSRCCYCNRLTATVNHRVWDLEHIVPRSSHPQFMFVPKNLVVSCVDCNNEKGETQVLVNPRRVTYPSRSEDFKIIQPHLDTFSDHIYVTGFVFLPMTDKGTFTIRTCNLLRYAQKYIDWPSVITDRRFEREVDEMVGGGVAAVLAAQEISLETGL